MNDRIRYIPPREIQPHQTPDASLYGRILSYVFLAYLSSQVLDAPLRYALSRAGAGSALYLRDLALVLAIGFSIWTESRRLNTIVQPVTLAAYLLALHTLVAILNNVPIFSALLGVKMYLAFLFGLAMPAASTRGRLIERLMPYLWGLVIIGILLQYRGVAYPWIGLQYDTAFGSVDASKQWWTGDLLRISGFSRASYDAAMIAGLLGLYLLTMSKNVLLRSSVYLLTIFAVYITTTKGMLLALVVSGLWIFMPGQWHKRRGFAIAIVVTLASIVIALPVYVVGYGVTGSHGLSVPSALMSLWDRFENMWPRSFDEFKYPYQYLTGLGLGAVGTPRLLQGMASYGDNLFVYQFSNFGAFSFAYGASVIGTLFLPSKLHGVHKEFPVALSIVTFAYGLTANMIEQPVFGMLLGLSVAQIWKSRADQVANA